MSDNSEKEEGEEDKDKKKKKEKMKKKKKEETDEEEEEENDGDDGKERKMLGKKRRRGEEGKKDGKMFNAIKVGGEAFNVVKVKFMKVAKEKARQAMMLLFVLVWSAAVWHGLLTKNFITADVCVMCLVLFIIILLK
jgi:hypothetical protein